MDIPLEKAVWALLSQGNVFYFSDPSYETEIPHNFILLNCHPSDERDLVFVGGTSKVDKVKHDWDQEPTETLVLVDPSEYPDFTTQTIFNCNIWVERSFSELVQLIRHEKRLKPRDNIGRAILGRLIRGVLASRLVPQRIKNEVCPS